MDATFPSPHNTGRDGLDLALQREMQRGERVLWQGRPIPRVQPASFGIFLFAIPWTAFSLFWTAMAGWGAATAMEGEWGWIGLAFPLFGVPFIAVGLGMLSTPFLPLFTASKTQFAVTNQRLIKLTLGRSLSSETVPANRIGHIKRSERSDGSGSLTIAIRVGVDGDGDRSTEVFHLGEVANVLEVEQTIGDVVERDRRQRG
ncbi:hypothetical protein [Parerythrobacter jejuensis]|uniref:DUF304 domain-containing protein n=1 Tax=Parerythrobacter jejuensis TaxID=795812 RepID=A0A845AR72_9SPHN|nr:hypothetical protein [Parerythrobacter jejuensis]MXP31979.1 hypothetical protein [Parerythrobacter jejuensis]